jgi:hypothetical protein
MNVNTFLLNEKMLELHPALKGKDMNKSTYRELVHAYVQKQFVIIAGGHCRLYSKSYDIGPHNGTLVYKLDGADPAPAVMQFKVALLSEDHDHVINHVDLTDGSFVNCFDFTDEYRTAAYDFSTHQFQYIDDFDDSNPPHHYWAAISLMVLAMFLLFGFLFLGRSKKK